MKTLVTVVLGVFFILTGIGLAPLYSQEKPYDAVNEVTLPSYARNIADFKCRSLYGEKESFDVETWYDEQDKLAVYVLIYK